MIGALRKRLKGDEQGFTLIELLVVIIILGILVAIAVPSYLSFKSKASGSAAQANVRAIVPDIEALYSDCGAYNVATASGSCPGLLNATNLLNYDQSIDTSLYNFSGQTATSYCVSSTKNGQTYKKAGPNAAIVSSSSPC